MPKISSTTRGTPDGNFGGTSPACCTTPAPDAAVTIPVPSRDVLTGILRNGAQRLLAQAVDAEVDAWITQHAESKDARGHQLVVRNGHHPTRTLVTGVGPVEVSQPRVWDRRIAGRRKVEVGPGQTVTEDIDAEGRPVERFRSTTSLPNTGYICGRRTRSKALSPPCGFAIVAPRATAAGQRVSRWCSSCASPRHSTGGS
jgi:hypothetical protein